jgi:hypothetical protein
MGGPDVVSTGSTDGETPTDQRIALLRVVKGEPTAEELAALVGVLASLGGPAVTPPPPAPVWNSPRRLHRVVPPHGEGGWRSSGLPR